ncbi:ribosomal L28e/Mak16 [Glomus cerebriforme]|uniref:Ribosomal L28e/Mak16 n=1 Tax=Glomus cerebriforme TaxID=658196 RepID=A0A397TK07_9GLOM|nr:ribosomal L28e/Mak16 [Glomus cerebriforme]
MSDDLTWLLIKNRSSFLVKRNGAEFNSEPNNLTNLNSFKYSGLANKKAIGVKDGPTNYKGVTVVTKKTNVASYKPAKSINKVILTKGVRKSAKSFTSQFTKSHYRPDLRKAALARISAIYQSQKPVKVHARKTGRRHTKKQKQIK